MISYLIIAVTELYLVDFNLILDTSIDTLNYNKEKDKCIIKWLGEQPDFVNNLQTKSPIYNNDEILLILKTPDWNIIIYSGQTE
jgi:hypothetical protein